MEIPVQVNGKLKGKLTISQNDQESDIKNKMLADAKLSQVFAGVEIVKFIYVKNKIINVVVK